MNRVSNEQIVSLLINNISALNLIILLVILTIIWKNK